jgi:predicted ATPase/transcriptional regulator with XRE-family HTH domain
MASSPFSTLLRRFRVRAGLSQEMLAERAGVSVKTVAALETGTRRSPYQGTVTRLADALRLPRKTRATLAAAAVRPHHPRTRSDVAETTRHNLPPQVSSLVGRGALVAEIRALFTRQRLVTLTGPGGIGKTRVALRVAEQLLPGFADGVWFVDLAPIEDASRVAERVASTFGLEDAPGDARTVSERLIASLRPQHLLLVLDNCEQVLPGVVELVSAVLPACQRVKILTTSRERLNVPGEHVYPVPALAVPGRGALGSARSFDSVRLFVERAGAVAPFANDDASALLIADICRRLDGIPLAIELAAARVLDLSLHDIALHLDQRFRILVDGARTAVPRQRTLSATIAWSVDALTPPQREFFTRVGIFANGWTLESAAKVCGDADDSQLDILERLSALVEKSLVVADTARVRARYRLLESTRLYALRLLDASGERAAIAARHARCFASFCDEAGEAVWTMQLAPWLAEVGQELDSVRAALAWALGDDGDTTVALRLASGFGPYWLFGGLGNEGRRWLEAALARDLDGVEPPIAARAWRNLAWLGRESQTLEAAQRAVALDERSGDAFAIGTSRRVRANSLVAAGRFAEAEAELDQVIALLRGLGMLGTIPHAHTLNIQAVAFKEQGRLDEARRALEAALAVYTETGDDLLAATAQGNLAELAFSVGDGRYAVELARTANLAWRRIGSATGQSIMCTNLAAYYLALGDLTGARQAAMDALVLAQRAQLPYTFFPALQHLAAVATLRGDARGGARLIGYVDSHNRARGYQREMTERRTYDILTNALDDILSADERDALAAEGERLDEAQAVELALAIV